MSKKKTFTSLSDLGGLVYSTDKEKMKRIKNAAPQEQTVEAHFSKKGRGGKVVTVLKGFRMENDELKALAKRIKSKLGVGGNAKNGEIIIQGNNRDKVIEILKDEGFKVKKVGG
jgi:translation initiation factor 1